MKMGVLSLITLTPLFMAACILVIPSVSKGLIRLLSLVATLVVFAGSVYVSIQYQPTFGGIQFREYTPLLPALGIAWKLGIDGWGIALTVFASVLSIASIFASWSDATRTKTFYVLLLLLLTGVLGLFVCLDLFVFFLLYQLALIPMYLLIGVWGQENEISEGDHYQWSGIGSVWAVRTTLRCVLH